MYVRRLAALLVWNVTPLSGGYTLGLQRGAAHPHARGACFARPQVGRATPRRFAGKISALRYQWYRGGAARVLSRRHRADAATAATMRTTLHHCYFCRAEIAA